MDIKTILEGMTRPSPLSEAGASFKHSFRMSHDDTDHNLAESAESLEVGDRVKADERYGDKTGHISDFGRDKAFVVVKHDDGTSSSYHSSNVHPHEDEDEDDIHEDKDESKEKCESTILSFNEFCAQFVQGQGTEVQGNTYGEPFQPNKPKEE